MTDQPKDQPRELDEFMDFMEEEDGFLSPPMPSTKHPDGRKYRIHSPSAKIGIRLNALSDIMVRTQNGVGVSEADVARLRMDDDDESVFVEQVLSKPTIEEMVADGVKWEHIRRMSTYAFIRFAISKQAADEAVRNGLLKGKEPAPTNRAARRGKSKKSKRK